MFVVVVVAAAHCHGVFAPDCGTCVGFGGAAGARRVSVVIVDLKGVGYGGVSVIFFRVSCSRCCFRPVAAIVHTRPAILVGGRPFIAQQP